jgi:pilus assembly protein CpaE
MANEVMKVLIVDDIPETREMLRKLLSFEADIDVVGTASTGREAMEFVSEFKPDIVLMDINMPDIDGITATVEIKKMHPAAGVIIMSVQNEADYLRSAMVAGARDFVTKPVSGEDLYETIHRVFKLQQGERTRMTSLAKDGGGAPGKKPEAKKGHIIAVYSPQGGAGVTTIATNLAVSLMRAGTRAVLIDGDLQWGDVGVFLNLTSKYTVGDLVAAITELDEQYIENMTVAHASGLRVLMAPRGPEDAEKITNSDLATIIQHVSRYYDYIIVDMSKRLDSGALSILDGAERIILVATPTLPGVKNTRLALDLFLSLEYPMEKVMFVMNRVNSDVRGRTSIPLDAIENNLKRPIDARIPLDELSFLSAVNQGVSVIATGPGKSPAADLIGLADKVRRSLDGAEVELVAPVVPQSRFRLSDMWSGSNS